MDFVAIDFETANRSWDSACEIGLVVVEDGRIVDTYRRLIRPTPNRFDAGNIRIHRITPEQVMREPTFAELYDELLPYLEDRHLVAHNASFDVGVLLAGARQYGLPAPTLTYSCTVQLARRVWPEAPRYGLGIISAFLGIELDHHRALSDASACAQIMLQAQQLFGCEHVDELLREVNLRPRSIHEYGSSGGRKTPWTSRAAATATAPRRDYAGTTAPPERTSTAVSNWPSHPRIKDIRFDASRSDPAHPAHGKRFAFTGELEYCSREQAQRMVLEVGGRCTASVTNATDFLVQGIPTTYRKPTGKARRAAELREAGRPIEVIHEVEFLTLFGREC